jgi:uncharacterized protein YjiS (DUF1127 family)
MRNTHNNSAKAALVPLYPATYITLKIVHRTRSVLSGMPLEEGKNKMTTINMGREMSNNQGLGATPGLMGSVKAYLSRTRAERQLRQLDDRLLADIGLKRADISNSVWTR